MCDVFDGRFNKGCVIFDRIKTDFLKQLKLPAAHSPLQRQRKGSNYAETKAWQNERCFQLELWLFHYFNIYKGKPPTVVWAVLCMCVGERPKDKDRQTASKGVASSDKLNLMNEPSGKK